MDSILIQIQHGPIAAFIFLITIVTSIAAFNDPVLKANFLLHPFSWTRGERRYSIITSGFIHGDWMHLGMNMFTFWYFAFYLERFMVFSQAEYMADKGFPDWIPRAIGETKFLFFYVVCLVLADLTTILQHKDNSAYSCLGASGALSGVIISLIIFEPIRIEIFGLPGWIFGIVYLIGSYIFSKRSEGIINHAAHFWGAAAGFVFTLLLFPKLTAFRISQLLDLTGL